MHDEIVVVLHRGSHGIGAGGLSGHHLHQRQQIHRVEGVADEDALRMTAALSQAGGQKPRRAAGDHGGGSGGVVEAAKQGALDRFVLRGALLHPVGGSRHRLGGIGPLKPGRVGPRKQAEAHR